MSNTTPTGFSEAAYDAASAARRVAEARDDALAAITDPTLLHLIAHFQAANVSPKDALAAAQVETRLSDDEFQAVLEAMPVHFVLTKEAPKRWRVSITGQHTKFGHGASARESVESFVLGAIVLNSTDAAEKVLSRLPESVQREIAERDQAMNSGQDPVKVAQARQAEEAAAAGVTETGTRPSIFELTAGSTSDDADLDLVASDLEPWNVEPPIVAASPSDQPPSEAGIGGEATPQGDVVTPATGSTSPSTTDGQ